MAESEEELKSLLTKVKVESEKVGLKLNIQKRRSWHLVPSLHGKQMGKKMERMADFTFLVFKITADGDYSHEIKIPLFLGRKAMTKLDSILKKQRHYFANEGPYSQSCGFSSSHVWM